MASPDIKNRVDLGILANGKLDENSHLMSLFPIYSQILANVNLDVNSHLFFP